MIQTKIKTEVLILSDLHMGSGACRAKEALQLMKKSQFNKLVLNGDVFQPLERFTDDEMALITYLRWLVDQTEVVVVRGNHDDDEIIYSLLGVEPVNSYEWSMNGKRFCALHGHLRFENVWRLVSHPWIDRLLTNADNSLRPGSLRWTIALRKAVKKFFSARFTQAALSFVRRTGLRLIASHTHDPVHIERYINSGSWVEPVCSYVTIDKGGNRELRHIDTQAPDCG